MKCGFAALLCLLTLPEVLSAIEPGEVVLVANRNMPQSKEVAAFYSHKRGIPQENVLYFDLPTGEDINFLSYQSNLVLPLRAALRDRKDHIKVVLCIYGVPLRVGAELPSNSEMAESKKLGADLKQDQDRIKKMEIEIKELGPAAQADKNSEAGKKLKELNDELQKLRAQVLKLEGRRRWLSHAESVASVDSELMHLWWDKYERRRFLANSMHWHAPKSVNDGKPPLVMTCRLDGPTPEIAKRLVTDAVAVEKTGLAGKVCVDARDQRYDPKTDQGYGYGGYDESMREMAALLKDHGKLDVVLDNKSEVFKPGACPDCALYCGWYSHANYVDSCKFVKGAVAWHLASSEAVSLRRKDTKLWCPKILENGACATLGPVGEPYTLGFPKPAEFFGLLATGEYTIVECYAKTLNVTSWMCTLIADPLYNPFKAKPCLKSSQVLPSPKGGRFLAR